MKLRALALAAVIVAATVFVCAKEASAQVPPQFCLYVVDQAVGGCGDINAGDIVCSPCARPCSALSCVGQLVIGRVTRACILLVSTTGAFGRGCGRCFDGELEGWHELGAGWVCQ
ncbi:MAG: hypothetical protein ACREQ9_22345 [Candidatus Binatia bacterium]